MSKKGLEKVRELTPQGFFYDNLMKMAECCKEEENSDNRLIAFVLQSVFHQLADAIGDGPVIKSELRKMEVRFKSPINRAVDGATLGKPADDQHERLTRLVGLLWGEEP